MRNNFSVLYIILLCILSACHSGTQLNVNLINRLQPVIKFKANAEQLQAYRSKNWEQISKLYILNNKLLSNQTVALKFKLQNDSLMVQPLLPLGENLEFEWQIFSDGVVIKEQFKTIAVQHVNPVPKVTKLFPISDTIPANILMFHVYFDQPMNEDPMAFKHIDIIDKNGKIKSFAWRQKSTWTDSGKHLVLMVHPGRIKRGIAYTDDGPLFEPNEKYTLRISKHIKNKYNQSLKETHLKTLFVKSALRKELNENDLDVILPKINSRESLKLLFSRPIDIGSLNIGVEVLNEKGESIAGQFFQDNDHQRYFVPNFKWEEESLTLVFTEYFSDLSSNHFKRAFEEKSIDGFKEREKFSLNLKL
jgi:hypothetical protein